MIKGQHHSEESKQKIRELRKLQVNTNKGMHWKIKDTSKMGKHLLGKESNNPFPKGHKINNGRIPWNKGKHTGIKPWLGKNRSEETKNKIRENRKGKMIGKENPSWKGGITPINNKIRGSIEYTLWQNSVLAKNGYCCQKCREIKMSYKLVAHHILNFAQYSELRFAIDNGRTLCVPCHKAIGWSPSDI